MTTYELLEGLNELLKEKDEDKLARAIISQLASLDHEISILVEPHSRLEASTTFSLFMQEVRAKTSARKILFEARDLLNSLKPREFFTSLGNLETLFSQSNLKLSHDAFVPDLHDKLSDFSREYETYISYGKASFGLKAASQVTVILIIAGSIQKEFDRLKIFRKLVTDNLVRSSEVAVKGRATLSILLHSQFDLPMLVEKLNALNLIYVELCELLKISPREFPLGLEKIESGSLWTKIFGEPRVIPLMVSLFQSTVSFLHRNFTTEGKLAALPKNFEIIAAMLELEHKLKESGIDTAEMKDNIQKSSILISRHLNRLLGDEPVVEINRKKYSVGAELEKVYLGQNQQHLLEEGNDADGESNEAAPPV